MNSLDKHRCLDWQYCQDRGTAARALSTAPLFGADRGKMFGVLLCRDSLDREVLLKGFSGQYCRQWLVSGWVGPLFNVADFAAMSTPVDRRIKVLDACIRQASGEALHQAILERRALSRELTRAVHGLYRLHNFRGERAGLQEAWCREGGLPTGSGDCCAPKLLNYAALAGLRPVSLSEFYWGRETRSGSRQHGCFYPPCQEKCAPLLGWMLCGLERQATRQA
ncbi:MAG: hypothetical protein CSA21_00340 [Deltaproteobacteria bacterium]|nr:MAG: hypothetical protein CSA21_00340 [Deltaproteobacteria bacterium]